MNKNLLNTSKTSKISKMIKRLILLLLVMVTPIVVFAEQTSDYSDTIEETVDVGKGLNIMPNLEGSEFSVVEIDKNNIEDTDYDDNDEIIEDEPIIQQRAFRSFALAAVPAVDLKEPHFGNFIGKQGVTTNIYKNSDLTSTITYIEPIPNSSGVVPILDQSNFAYKIAISGVIGWVDKNVIEAVKHGSAKGNDHYQLNASGELIHYISKGTNTNTYSYINQGKAPSYLVAGKTYLSYDGHYFYNDDKAGLTNLIKDYNAGVRTNSLNKDNPYYNYFQFLPARSQTNLKAEDFKRYLVNYNSSYASALNSKLAETEQLFVDNGNIFGSNSALAFASAVHESGWGTSGFSKSRNNFFGHNAYDSNPGLATSYNSPNTGITSHFARFLNWNYLDAGDPIVYNGGFVGNKNLGMNVKYASDPYWGEKIAAHYYNMDKLAGGKDYRFYTLAMTKNNNEKVYKEASTSKGSPYSLKQAGITLAVTNLVENSAGQWFQFSSESHLTKSKDLESWSSDRSKVNIPYNISNNQLYINAKNVTVISRSNNSADINNDGKINGGDMARLEAYLRGIYKLDKEQSLAADISNDGKVNGGDMARLEAHLRGIYTIYGNVNRLLKQSSASIKTAPNYSSKSTKYTTTKATKLYPDWSTDYASILTIGANVTVEGITTDNGWLLIQHKHSNGSTYIGYVKVSDLKTTTSSSNPIDETKTKNYKVTSDVGLRIRETPSTSGNQLGTIPFGEIVQGIEDKDGWIKVTYKGIEGYSSAEYLEESN